MNEVMNKFAIYWLSQLDTEFIRNSFKHVLKLTPAYFQEQFDSRFGRAGRGRLWASREIWEIIGDDSEFVPDIKEDDWGSTNQHIDDQDCGGIIIYKSDIERFAGLPGFVTNRYYEPINKYCA